MGKVSGAREKLKRARKHIKDFEAGIARYLREDGNRFVPDTNSGSAQKEMLLQYGPIPDDLVCAVGDAIHNLRSALDHVAFAVAERRVTGELLGSVSFTACKTKDGINGFDEAIKKRKVECIGTEWVTFLNRVEPYHGGKGVNLYVINALDNIDKHRKLIVLVPEADRYRSEAKIRFEHARSLEPGVKLSTDPRHPNQKTYTQLRVSIRERDIPGLDQYAFVETLLNDLADSVSEVIERAVTERLLA